MDNLSEALRKAADLASRNPEVAAFMERQLQTECATFVQARQPRVVLIGLKSSPALNGCVGYVMNQAAIKSPSDRLEVELSTAVPDVPRAALLEFESAAIETRRKLSASQDDESDDVAACGRLLARRSIRVKQENAEPCCALESCGERGVRACLCGMMTYCCTAHQGADNAHKAACVHRVRSNQKCLAAPTLFSDDLTHNNKMTPTWWRDTMMPNRCARAEYRRSLSRPSACRMCA